jgi:chromosome segregation ATPase
MSLWKKVAGLFKRTSDENLSATPEGRKKLAEIFQKTHEDFQEALRLREQEGAIYKGIVDKTAKNLAHIAELQRQAAELRQELRTLDGKYEQLGREQRQKADSLDQKADSLDQRANLLDQLTARCDRFDKNYGSWEERFLALNKSSPTYKADRAKLTQERRALQKEYLEIKKQSKLLMPGSTF